MKKSGLADSPFFKQPEAVQTTETPLSPNKSAQPTKRKVEIKKERLAKDSRPIDIDTMTPRYRDTTVSRLSDAVIELVRKAVKELGKEAATHRFTQAEKREVADIIYTYRNQGVKTSENEITRISVNFIVEDYKENGENSILHKILEALNQ